MSGLHRGKNVGETNLKGRENAWQIWRKYFTMLIMVPDCESETYTKSMCNNAWETATHKPSKVFDSVASDHFHASFFWMCLDDNREPRLASKNGRNVSGIYTRFFIFLSAWVLSRFKERRMLLCYLETLPFYLLILLRASETLWSFRSFVIKGSWY
jgi:hypothetical protein